MSQPEHFLLTKLKGKTPESVAVLTRPRRFSDQSADHVREKLFQCREQRENGRV